MSATPSCSRRSNTSRLRWLWLDPQFYGRIRFDAGGYRALRIEELKLSARVAAERVRETHSPFRFNRHGRARTAHPAPGVEGRIRRSNLERRRRRRTPGRRVPRRVKNPRSSVWADYGWGFLKPWDTTLALIVKHHLKCESGAIGSDSDITCAGRRRVGRLRRIRFRGKIARRKFQLPFVLLADSHAILEIARTKDRPERRVAFSLLPRNDRTCASE